MQIMAATTVTIYWTIAHTLQKMAAREKDVALS